MSETVRTSQETSLGEEVRMKRSIILFSLLILTVGSIALPASAENPSPASGTWDYEITAPPEMRFAGPNVFIYGQDQGTWAGTLNGFSQEEFVVVCHPEAGFSYYAGEMTFVGTVIDDGVEREGEMVIKTNGKQYSDTCDPSDAQWNGHWVIIGGSGGLEDVHGQGTFSGPSFHLFYDGQVHFRK